MRSEIFKSILAKIKSERVRSLAIYALEASDEYFWKVPASSTGKYHPKTSLGEMGLVRHTYTLCSILEQLFEIELFEMSEFEQDLCRLAGLVHDIKKHGEHVDDTKKSYTVHEHPLLAADYLEECNKELEYPLKEDELEKCLCAIRSHMGKWNTSKKSDVVLPKPTNNMEWIVHIADYMASRRFLEMTFDDEEKFLLHPQISIDDYVLDFGKHKNEKLVDVAKEDEQYIRWLAKTVDTKEPLTTFVKSLLK